MILSNGFRATVIELYRQLQSCDEERNPSLVIMFGTPSSSAHISETIDIQNKCLFISFSKFNLLYIRVCLKLFVRDKDWGKEFSIPLYVIIGLQTKFLLFVDFTKTILISFCLSAGSSLSTDCTVKL